MMRRGISNRLLAVIVLFLAAGVGFLAYQALKQGTGVIKKHETVQRIDYQAIDQALKLSAWNEFKTILQDSLELADTAAAYLRLAKRVRVYAVQSGDYSLFEQVVREGHQSFPGREDLRSLYAYALMRQGMETDSRELIEQSGEQNLSMTQAIEQELSLSNSREHPSEPRRFTAEELLEMGEQLNSRRITGDAMLLYLAESEHEKALEAAEQLLEDLRRKRERHESGELLFLVFADDGSYTDALESLDYATFSPERRWLFKADIYMLEGNSSEAFSIYRKIIEDSPEFSSLAFYNQQVLFDQGGDTSGEAGIFLKKGLQYHSDQADYLLRAAAYLYGQDEYHLGLDFLNGYEEAGGSSPKGSMLRQLLQGSAHPAAYRSFVNRLLGSDEGRTRDRLHALWYFYGLRDSEEIDRLLTGFSQGKGTGIYEAEAIFAEALSHTLKQRGDEALKSFSRAWELDSDLWEAAYNAAMICRQQGKRIETAAWLKKAEAALPSGNRRRRGDIYYRMAENEYGAGDTAEARRLISFALDVDPENPSARSFQRLLDDSASW